MAGSSTIEELPPQHQGFIHFRGEELVHRFVGQLHRVLRSNNIKFFIDDTDVRDQEIEVQFQRIKESTIALVILSGKYTESTSCLRELTLIADCVEKGKLVVIPIFYKLDPLTVRYRMGQFGDAFDHLPGSHETKKRWKKALKSITDDFEDTGIIVDHNSDEAGRLEMIVILVKEWLNMFQEENQEPSVDPSEDIETRISAGENKIVVKEFGISAGGNKSMEEVNEMFNKIPSEGSQETFVDPSENIETRISDVSCLNFSPNIPVTRPETDFFSAMTGSSMMPPQNQVFINVHGKLSCKFVNRIVKALLRDKINVFIDKDEGRGQSLEVPMKTIEESRIALVIFSREYTELGCRLEELVKIANCVEKGKLVAIPVFYKLDQSTIRNLRGQSSIGDAFRNQWARDAPKERWKKALKLITNTKGIIVDQKRDLGESDATKEIWKKSITQKPGIVVDNMSGEKETLKKLVDEVKSVLNKISSEGSLEEASVDPSENSETGNSPGFYKVVDEVRKSQKASVDPSEHIDTRISSGGEKDKPFGIKQPLKDLNKITSQLAMKIITQKRMIIGFLLVLFLSQHIAYMRIGEGGDINGIVENVVSVLEFSPADRTENPRDKFTEFPTGKFGTNPESSSSDAKTNADLLERTFSSSPMDVKVTPPKIQVFINFRGEQLRTNFVGYLVDALRKSGVNIFIDTKANIGDDLINLFKRIEDSGIAIVVFSSRYTESEWCLNELVKIKERVQQGLLKVLPIFYKVIPSNVKRLKGEFGDNFRDKEHMYASDEPKMKQWKEAIELVSHKFALTFHEKSCILEVDFIETIVQEVLKMLQDISTVESGQSFC